MKHTHDDGRPTFGCPACIVDVRAAEAEARWTTAPLRTVTFECSFFVGLGEVKLTLELEVPADATPSEIQDFHADLIGEAFLMALPDDVDIDLTDMACETMEIEHMTIGALVEPPTTADPGMVSMFEVSS